MIGLYNTKSDLRSELENVFDIAGLDKLEPDAGFPKINGLFIDWKTKEKDEYQFAHQAVIVEAYVKQGVPTVIFDRHMAISHKEYNWLKKFNVTFFEPAIKNRVNFGFIPFWTKPIDSESVNFDDIDRKINLAYHGDLSDKIFSFEKYFIEYVKLYPQKNNSTLRQPESLRHKIDKWSEYINFTDKIVYNDVNFTILIGSKKEYEIGYLREDLFDIMSCGCIPLLPVEHRFYGTVFKDLMIKDIGSQHWFIDGYSKYRNVMIEEIQNNFLSIYPECNIKNIVEKIRRLFTI